MPVIGSSPTVPTAARAATIAAVLSRDPPDTKLITHSASSISTTSTDGPMASSPCQRRSEQHQPEDGDGAADEAADGATISAGPARPWRAIS